MMREQNSKAEGFCSKYIKEYLKKKRSQCQLFRQCCKKHEIEVLKKIREIQDELVSEAEHRIKKFDDIHAQEGNQLGRGE